MSAPSPVAPYDRDEIGTLEHALPAPVADDEDHGTPEFLTLEMMPFGQNY